MHQPHYGPFATHLPHTNAPKTTGHPETPKQKHLSLKTSLLQLICPKQTHQNHMPSRGTQTATHQLDTFANQFPNTSATETTCHPETPEQEALSDRNRTLNGKGARQVHNWMATAAPCAHGLHKCTLPLNWRKLACCPGEGAYLRRSKPEAARASSQDEGQEESSHEHFQATA